jgi:hypothetical protein
MTLTPAYGRDYRTEAAVLKDWHAGKDFRISDVSSRDNGRYCSVRDFPDGYSHKLRYNKLADFVIVEA